MAKATKRMLEIREYNFKGGVTLYVQLDKRTKQASFVTWDKVKREYAPQEFVFANRQVEYMNGWLNILSAIRYVINDVKPEMESWDSEETERLIQVLSSIEKEKKNDQNES